METKKDKVRKVKGRKQERKEKRKKRERKEYRKSKKERKKTGNERALRRKKQLLGNDGHNFVSIGFDVSTTVKIHVVIFWVVAHCNGYQYFRETYCLLLQI
jgi:hypothetical protein